MLFDIGSISSSLSSPAWLAQFATNCHFSPLLTSLVCTPFLHYTILYCLLFHIRLWARVIGEPMVELSVHQPSMLAHAEKTGAPQQTTTPAFAHGAPNRLSPSRYTVFILLICYCHIVDTLLLHCIEHGLPHLASSGPPAPAPFVPMWGPFLGEVCFLFSNI
jgi:hypothetical protein